MKSQVMGRRTQDPWSRARSRRTPQRVSPAEPARRLLLRRVRIWRRIWAGIGAAGLRAEESTELGVRGRGALRSLLGRQSPELRGRVLGAAVRSAESRAARCAGGARARRARCPRRSPVSSRGRGRPTLVGFLGPRLFSWPRDRIPASGWPRQAPGRRTGRPEGPFPWATARTGLPASQRLQNWGAV